MPTKLPCHQAEWHQQRQPGGRRWQQHTALTGMSTEMQLRPLTAYSFWRSALRGKSFNRPDFKYFSNLPNHICCLKWRVLMFKQSIRTTQTNFTECSGEWASSYPTLTTEVGSRHEYLLLFRACSEWYELLTELREIKYKIPAGRVGDDSVCMSYTDFVTYKRKNSNKQRLKKYRIYICSPL